MFALCLLLFAPSAALAQTATPPAQHDHGQAQPPAAQVGQESADEVDRLVAKMNAATGNEKLTAMSDLLSLLVKERATPNAQAPAPAMKGPMMGGAMMSGQMGSCMADGKCACPMMQHDKP
jgi:hypothetical protein